MAAPTVRGRTAPVAGLSATSPAGTAIGDAVIVFSWEQTGAGIPTHTLQSNFVELISHGHDDGSTDGRLSVAYKIATSGGATSYQAYTSSVGTTVRTGIIVLEVGTHSLGTTQKGAAASASVTATGTQVPNPPSVTLGTAREWLAVAISGWHLSASATVTPTAPTNYGNLQEVAGASASEVASVERTVGAVASEDPGGFGDNVTPNGTASVTLGFPGPVERAAAIDGAGDISSGGTFFSILERATALDAAAAIASSGEVVSGATSHERAAAIAATADIASSATFLSIFERASALAATGAISSSAIFFSILERASALAATASISSAAMRELLRAAALAATASLEAAGDVIAVLSRAAALGATASVASSGVRIVSRSSSLTATAGIATDRELELFRSVSLNATAGIASSGSAFEAGVVVSSARIDATATITSAAAPSHNRSTAIGAVALISSSGSITAIYSRSSALSALAVISSSGSTGAVEVLEFPTGLAPVLLKPNRARIGGTGTRGRIESPDRVLIGGPS